MKKLTTISLFVFGVIVTALLTAGLVFYQNKKDNQSSTSQTNTTNIVQDTIAQINSTKSSVTGNNVIKNNITTGTASSAKTNVAVTTSVVNSIILNMAEIAKHNMKSDCWLLINDKVYNITSYFGSHPGGSRTMSETCGKDATNAYYTQDPNATSSSSKSAHSSRALSLLNNYYLGDLNQIISN